MSHLRLWHQTHEYVSILPVISRDRPSFTSDSMHKPGLQPPTWMKLKNFTIFLGCNRKSQCWFARMGRTESQVNCFYGRFAFQSVGCSSPYHIATHLIPCSVNGVGPQMQTRTLDLSKLLFKNSERRAGEMCPRLPFHSEVGAETTNSTSNLEKRNIF